MTILRIEHEPASRTIRLRGELDHSSAPDLVATLALSTDMASDLHLDLRGLTFMDSTGLHLIVDVTRALTGGAALVLIGPRPPVTRVLEISSIVDQIPNLRVVADAGPEAGTGSAAEAAGRESPYASLPEAPPA